MRARDRKKIYKEIAEAFVDPTKLNEFNSFKTISKYYESKFVCDHLNNAIWKKDPCKYVEDSCPEFMLFKPQREDTFIWWEEWDRDSRANALLFCYHMIN